MGDVTRFRTEGGSEVVEQIRALASYADGRCEAVTAIRTCTITPAEYDRLAALLTGEGAVPSARELAEAYGFAPLSPEEFRMNVDRECRAAETDPRTPGQVAYETYCNQPRNTGRKLTPWEHVQTETQREWNEVAAMVLARGRKK